jgi:hypothetical protein
MNNLGQTFDEKATGGAGLSPDSIGAQILAKGGTVPEVITRIPTELPIKMKKETPRGGRRTQADGLEIRQVLSGIKKDEARLERDVEKLKQDKERVLADLADLRIKDKQAQEANLSSFTKKHITGASTHIQKKLAGLNSILPEINPGDDHARVQSIIKKYHESERIQKHAEKNLAKAEHALEKNPDNAKAIGQANRAHNEMFAAKETEKVLVAQAELLDKNMTPNPSRDEGVLWTAKDAANEAMYLEERSGGKKPDLNILELVEKTKATINTTPEKAPQEPAHPEFPLVVENVPTQFELPLVVETDPVQYELPLTDLPETKNEAVSLTPYDTALDRQWEENTEKREGSGINVPDWSMSPKENVPQEIGTPEFALNPEEATETPVGVVREGQEEAFAQCEKNTTTPYENAPFSTYQRIMDKLPAVNAELDARAEKAGMGTRLFQVAEKWNTLKSEHKYAYASILILAGLGSMVTGTALAGGAVSVATTTLRFVSGAGIFYSKNKQYEAEAKNEGRERTPKEFAKDRLKAIAWGVLAGGLLSYVLGTEAHIIKGEITALMENPPVEGAPSVVDTVKAPPAGPKMDFVVEKGDTLWGDLEKSMGDGDAFQAVKGKIGLMSSEQLKLLGISSGDIELIRPGDHIDLTNIDAIEISPDDTASSVDTGAPDVTQPEPTTMPQEITPGDPQILEYANHEVSDDMGKLFDEKKYFGIFGDTPWEKSIHMADPTVGFVGKSVDEILAAHPSAFPEGGGNRFGTENYFSTKKVQDYIANIFNQTGLKHEPGEKFLDYAKRAAATKISTFMNKV